MNYVSTMSKHAFIILCVLFFCMPLYLAIIAASHDASLLMTAPAPMLPGDQFISTMHSLLYEQRDLLGGMSVGTLFVNSFIMASLIACGKGVLALMAGFALVYFSFPF